MKQEHKYAQVLRWIADGKKVQGRSADDKYQWNDIDDWNETALSLLIKGGWNYEFRIAPRTVKIGDVEIEAPIRMDELNDRCFSLDDEGRVKKVWEYTDIYVKQLVQRMQVFRTPEAAEAAHAAWVKLMKGEA